MLPFIFIRTARKTFYMLYIFFWSLNLDKSYILNSYVQVFRFYFRNSRFQCSLKKNTDCNLTNEDF